MGKESSNLDAVMNGVEELAATDGGEDRVVPVIYHVVCGDWRESIALECEQASFHFHSVLLSQKLRVFRHSAAAEFKPKQTYVMDNIM